MQLQLTLVAAYLFGTAMAGYNIKETPANKRVSGTGSSARLARRDDGGPAFCTDNSDCQGLDQLSGGGNECLLQSRHDYDCFDGNCWVINRDAYALFKCLYGVDMDDACYRGHPGNDDYWARGVYGCDEIEGNGNVGCDSEQNPCLEA